MWDILKKLWPIIGPYLIESFKPQGERRSTVKNSVINPIVFILVSTILLSICAYKGYLLYTYNNKMDTVNKTVTQSKKKIAGLNDDVHTLTLRLDSRISEVEKLQITVSELRAQLTLKSDIINDQKSTILTLTAKNDALTTQLYTIMNEPHTTFKIAPQPKPGLSEATKQRLKRLKGDKHD